MDTREEMTNWQPEHLVVVGAAAGIGRWLCEHLFASMAWTSVTVVDTPSSTDLLRSVAGWFAPVASIAAAAATGSTITDAETGRPRSFSAPDTAVVVAVPAERLADLVDGPAFVLDPTAQIIETTATKANSIEALRRIAGAAAVIGMHPLFDSSARSLDGNTVYVVPDGVQSGAHRWLVDAVKARGGTIETGTATEHDLVMSYVQTLTHQTLVEFVDALTSSNLSLEHDLWEARTPLFESLLGLAVRVLGEANQPTLAAIQTSNGGARVAGELEAAGRRFAATLADHDATVVERHLETIRERFTGQLFDTIGRTASAGVNAAQHQRSEIGRHLRTGELVGIRVIGRSENVRVGRIVHVSPIEVTLEELMIGRPGHAVLLDGPGRDNARRLGVSGKPKRTVFKLGRIDVVDGDELESALDSGLAYLDRDVRFLVPESVAGAGLLSLVASTRGVRTAAIVSEAVRTGQRECVVRVGVRADHDIEEAVERLRTAVNDAYAWPRGLARPWAGPVARLVVNYLGPAGTYSEAAARHCVEALGTEGIGADAELVPRDTFGDVLAGVGPTALAVLPVSSSASGLVTRAAEALLAHRGALAVSGVLDVAVRFDAYVSERENLESLRGTLAASHPQGLAQCGRFIERWGLVPHPCTSTAAALEQVASGELRGVALAGAESRVAGLRVAEREVDDLAGSITRFLLLGPPGGFGDPAIGSDPTLRSVVVAASLHDIAPALTGTTPSFDELLRDADGRVLWITSRALDHDALAELGAGVVHLGRAPWSPRTPVVRVTST